MPILAATDHAPETLDIERRILEPLGCRFTGIATCRDPEQLKALVRDADFVTTVFAPVNAEVIAAMTKCRLIVRYGIGVDNVDLAAAAARGIPVSNVPDYCTNEVADHALAMILSMTRRVSQIAVTLRAGGAGLGVPMEHVRTLSDMTVGIVGYGRIGREVALRLAPFHCRILAADPWVPPAAVTADGFQPVSLAELLARSDLVTLHCPSTAETRQMINASSLARMKRGSLLVNVSRGTLVNTDDLVAALRSGLLSGAGLDVVDPEPVPAGHPLLGMDNVLVTPHCAAASLAAILKLRTQVAETVAVVLRGGKPPNVVNGVRV